MRLSVPEIETMDRAALSAAWDAVFGSPVPKRLSSPFLRRYLAFEMQARERGGLPKGLVGKLQTHPLRDLHPQIDRRGARSGLQLARCAA
jgi:hypothetical protein